MHDFIYVIPTNVPVRAMKASGGPELQFFILLTSTLGGDEWSASRCSRFNPGYLNSSYNEGVWGTGITIFHILNLDTRWR